MEEKEKNQKTVVAFIAGLLIGGLLVWVFSIAPEKKEAGLKMGTTTEDTSSDTNSQIENGTTPNTTPVTSANPTNTQGTVIASADGSITVDDQPAGMVITLGEIKMPVASGWIAVHEVNADGSLGRVLGASRYTEADGLKPTTVESVSRPTKAGQTYRVVIYSENGDKKFSIAGGDKLVTKPDGSPIEDSFTAK